MSVGGCGLGIIVASAVQCQVVSAAITGGAASSSVGGVWGAAGL